MNETLRRALMAIVNRMGQGIRTTVSSRSFWRQFGFPLPQERRDLQRRAAAIHEASQLAESGQVSGNIGDLYSQQGYPTTDIGGGTMGTGAATLFARIPFVEEISTPDGPRYRTTWKSVSMSVPWDLPIDELESIISEAADDLAAKYGQGEPNLGGVAFLLY